MSNQSSLEMFHFSFNEKINDIKNNFIGVSLNQVSDAQRFLKGMSYCLLALNLIDNSSYEYIEECIYNLQELSLDKLLDSEEKFK